MFVRKKKNRIGTITVVIIDKCHGKFKEVHNLGLFQMNLKQTLCAYVGKFFIIAKAVFHTMIMVISYYLEHPGH